VTSISDGCQVDHLAPLHSCFVVRAFAVDQDLASDAARQS